LSETIDINGSARSYIWLPSHTRVAPVTTCALRLQPLLRPLLDQHIDQRQPPRLVDRFRQQFPVTIDVKSAVLHVEPPHGYWRSVFPKPWPGAIGKSVGSFGR